MFKKMLYLLACTLVNTTNAQVKPSTGSILNYRIIGFEVPQKKEAVTYVLQIALDSVVSNDQLDKRHIIEQASSSNRIIETVPTFNTPYSWHVIYKNKAGKQIGTTAVNYFKTGYVKFIDSAYYKLQVLSNKMKRDDIFILLDNSAVMYDLHGNPVWYLPNISEMDTMMHVMRDLKPTADGTFTAMFEYGIYEFDYNGKILWRGPLNGKKLTESAQTYHHDFTKLSNGHYMVAGNELVENEMPKEMKVADTGEVVSRDGKLFRKSVCGNLLEYDKTGKLVWSWRSSPFFPSVGVLSPDNKMATIGTHMNSFYFDEEDSVIYVGFRNISTIAKIDYPTGYIKDIYRGKVPERDMRADGRGNGRNAREERQTQAPKEEEMFSGQHACRVENKKVYVFNNNTIRNPNFVSYAEIYEEHDTVGKNLKKVYSYPCNIDTLTNPGSPTGGSIYPISDTEMLVCMGGAGRVFIVNTKKDLLWNAIPMFKRMDDQTKPLPQYRVSFMTKESFNKFLFK